MKRFLLAAAVSLFTILSASTLRGFTHGANLGDPEYYILMFSMICGGLSALSLWRLTEAI